MTTADARVETFRANWIFILLLVLFGAAMLATAFDTFVVTCTIAFSLHDYDSSRGVRVFGWAFSTLCTGLFGWVLWMQAVAVAHYAARLDDRGVDFCFSSKKNTRDYYFKWDEIAAVRHKKGRQYVLRGGERQFFGEVYEVHLLSAQKTGASDRHPCRTDHRGRQALTLHCPRA